jgi:hypothetical protein
VSYPPPRAIFKEIVASKRYLDNIEYGKPRRGHAEGTVKAHIAELEKNLETLRLKSSGIDYTTYWQLKLLIHVHDSFKAESKRDAPIMDPQSHASIARQFLSGYTADPDLLEIVQGHDIGYAVYKKWKETGRMNEARLDETLSRIKDLDLFLLFAIIDACTESKGREMIHWLVGYVNSKYQVNIGTNWILPGKAGPNGEW